MVYTLDADVYDALNRNVHIDNNKRPREPYLDKFRGLNYKNTTIILREIANHFSDPELLSASKFMIDFYDNTYGDITALRLVSNLNILKCQNFEPEYCHLQDWALQSYNEPFARINPSHLYQKISQVNKQPAVSWYMFNEYPSYPKKYIDLAQSNHDVAHIEAQAQQTRQQAQIGGDIHGAARALGLSMTMLPQIEATFARIDGMNDVLRAADSRRSRADWRHWWDSELLPWLNGLRMYPKEIGHNRGANNIPTFDSDVTTFLKYATERKNLLNAMAEYENVEWSELRQQKREELANTVNHPLYQAESLRLLSLMLGYFKSKHFQQIAEPTKQIFYIDFFSSLNEGFPFCDSGFFERVILGFQKKLLSLHKDNIDPSFQGAQDVFEQMLDLAIKEDTTNILHRNIVPSPVLNALFMRVLKSLEQRESSRQSQPWQVILRQLRNDPKTLPLIETLPFNPIPKSNNRFYQIKSEHVITPDQTIFIEALSPKYAHFVDGHFLSQHSISDIEEKLKQLGFMKDFKKQARESFLDILRKKKAIYEIQSEIEKELLKQSLQITIEGSLELENELSALLRSNNQLETAKTLGTKIMQCARKSQNNKYVAQAMRAQTELINECKKTRLMTNSPAFEKTKALCQLLATPTGDRTFEADLRALFEKKIVPVNSPIAAVVQKYTDYFETIEIDYYEPDELPRMEDTPNIHDFLREAQRLSGLPRRYLKLVLSILGRPTRHLLVQPPENDPFNGEDRSLYRGLERLADQYRSIIVQGPKAHKAFLTDKELTKELVRHHQINAQTYLNLPEEKRHLLKDYYATEAEVLSISRFSLEDLSHIEFYPEAIIGFLALGEVDIATDLLRKWQKSLILDDTNRETITVLCKKILNWIHYHQYYRLFTPLLELCDSIGLKKEVIEKDFMSKLCAFHEGQDILSLLHTLQINEVLIDPTAQLYAKVNFTASYLGVVMAHWEQHFEPMMTIEALINNLPASVPRDYPQRLQKSFMFLQLKHGFISKDILKYQEDNAAQFYINMMEYGIENGSSDTATAIFEAWLAPLWKNTSGLEISNKVLAPFIAETLYHPLTPQKNDIYQHIAQWLAKNHRTTGYVLDLNVMPSDKFNQPLDIDKLKDFEKIAQLFGFNAVIMPKKACRNFISRDVVEYIQANNKPSAKSKNLKFFYTSIGKLSLKMLKEFLFEKIKEMFLFLYEKARPWFFYFAGEQQDEEEKPKDEFQLPIAQIAFEKDGVGGVYKKNRELRFKLSDTSADAAKIMKQRIRY